MAKYDVHCACGHTETIELYGPHKERYRKIEWLEKEGKCSECYKKSQPHILRMEDHNGTPYLVAHTKISYEIKDTLKELGFRWGRVSGYWAYPLEVGNDQASGGEVAEDLDQLASELEGRTGLHFQVEVQGVGDGEQEVKDLKGFRVISKKAR